MQGWEGTSSFPRGSIPRALLVLDALDLLIVFHTLECARLRVFILLISDNTAGMLPAWLLCLFPPLGTVLIFLEESDFL